MPSRRKILPENKIPILVLAVLSLSLSHYAISQNNNVTSLLTYRTMEHRDYNYYKANAATINLGEITSSAKNAKILRRLRDGDAKLHHFSVGRRGWENYYIGHQGDDLGWLGYFIGRSACLHSLLINYLLEGEEGHAFVEDSIAGSQSIRSIGINNLNNDTFASVMRALHSLSQLEKLAIDGNNNVDPDDWSELGTLLVSGVCQLKEICLRRNIYIGNEGMGVLSHGLRAIGSSLKVLQLENNSIRNEGLSTLVEALQTCTGLEELDLSHNDFSSAAAGLGSLSDWLQYSPMNLKDLFLENCRISDEGLHSLAEGAANHSKVLDLDGNGSITSTGLSYLSSSIQSYSSRVETLYLQNITIGDDGLEFLAQGLADNKSVRSLYLSDLHDDVSITSAGWLAFSRALCDTSSVNSTYLSNHTICDIWNEDDEERPIPPQDISLHLQLNKEHPQYAARCKILMKHPHLNMTPLLHWGLKCLPLAVAWFERSKPCITLTIHDEDPDSRRRILEESDKAFESRELTAMYEFVRGMPMEVMKSRGGLALAATYDKKIARIEEEKKIALEQRDRKIEQLEEEITRLRGW